MIVEILIKMPELQGTYGSLVRTLPSTMNKVLKLLVKLFIKMPK